MNVQIESFSMAGLDKINEDFMKYATLSDGRTIVILADGMGGLSHGKLAAQEAVSTIFNEIAENPSCGVDEQLWKAFVEADRQVDRLSRILTCRMGAAVTAIVIVNDTVHFTWQGNVRLYVLSENEHIKLLTEDHVWHSDKGGGTFLTRCINGRGFWEQPPLGQTVFDKSTILCLCTDGFYRKFPDLKINGLDSAAMSIMPKTEDDSSLIKICLR